MWYTFVTTLIVDFAEVAMLKRMVTFTEPQYKWLESESDRLGVSTAELVRRLIDWCRGERPIEFPPLIRTTEVAEE